MSSTPPKRFVTVFVTEKYTQDPMASPSPTQHSESWKSLLWERHSIDSLGCGGFLHRSIAMTTTGFLLGTGVAIMLAAWTPGPGMAVWRSLRTGKNLATDQSNMASAGSLLGPSTQVCGWGVAFMGGNGAR